MTIQNYQRDALNIIYSSNIITLLYMFRVPSTHPQKDIVVHNPLKTKRRLLYLKTQFVPRSKHFSSQL